MVHYSKFQNQYSIPAYQCLPVQIHPHLPKEKSELRLFNGMQIEESRK